MFKKLVCSKFEEISLKSPDYAGDFVRHRSATYVHLPPFLKVDYRHHVPIVVVGNTASKEFHANAKLMLDDRIMPRTVPVVEYI